MTVEQIKENLSERDPDDILNILRLDSSTLVKILDEWIDDHEREIRLEL